MDLLKSDMKRLSSEEWPTLRHLNSADLMRRAAARRHSRHRQAAAWYLSVIALAATSLALPTTRAFALGRLGAIRQWILRGEVFHGSSGPLTVSVIGNAPYAPPNVLEHLWWAISGIFQSTRGTTSTVSLSIAEREAKVPLPIPNLYASRRMGRVTFHLDGPPWKEFLSIGYAIPGQKDGIELNEEMALTKGPGGRWAANATLRNATFAFTGIPSRVSSLTIGGKSAKLIYTAGRFPQDYIVFMSHNALIELQGTPGSLGAMRNLAGAISDPGSATRR